MADWARERESWSGKEREQKKKTWKGMLVQKLLYEME